MASSLMRPTNRRNTVNVLAHVDARWRQGMRAAAFLGSILVRGVPVTVWSPFGTVQLNMFPVAVLERRRAICPSVLALFIAASEN